MNELPPDAVYDLVRPMQVAVSPDGTRVAFQAIEHDRGADRRRSAIFTVPTDGSRDPHRLTRISDAGTMRWSPDGNRLGVVMTRDRDVELRVEKEAIGEDADDGADDEIDADHAGTAGIEVNDGGHREDDPQSQLWVYDFERGGDARQVTTFEEGIDDFDWGPAVDRVVVSARDLTEEEQTLVQHRREGGPIETEHLQHKFDGVGWLDSVSSYLFVVDVESRESRRLDEAHGGGILDPVQGLQPAWHPTDDRIAFVANHGENPEDTYAQDVHVVDVEGGETERFTTGEYMGREPTWSPDGSRLAVIASDPTNWYVPASVHVYDPDGERRVVTDALDRHLAWFERLVWLDEDRLLTAIGDEGWSRFARLSAGGGHERVFDCQSRDESLTHFDVSGGTVAFVRQHPRDGVDVFAMASTALGTDGDAADPRRRLTELNREIISDYPHPEIDRVTIEGVGGDDVEGIAFFPPTFDSDNPDGDRPLLLSIHGGPRHYDEPHFDFDTAFWTMQGYVVFKVNYHGSTSYGRAFCERLKGNWHDVAVTDLLAGTDELVERGWVDPDRLFVTGFSFGGRLTAALLAESDRFVAGVAEHGNYDARSAFGSDDRHQWWTNELGVPWNNPEAYDDASVITVVDDIDTPLLLTAGEDDLRDPSQQAEQLYVSLKKRGVDTRMVVYPGTSHVHFFIAEPDRAIHRLEAMSEWFDRFDPAVD